MQLLQTHTVLLGALALSAVSCSGPDSADVRSESGSATAPATSGVNAATAEPAATQPVETPSDTETDDEAGWIDLFDGKSLDGWELSVFGGDGDVRVENGELLIDAGVELTGVRYERKTPKQNYEVDLVACRVSGSDFFCGLTFPVGEDHCSLILGGWGGAVCGLSSIDSQDAARNDTTTYQTFETGRWYRVRLEVTPETIRAWLDGEKIVEQPIVGKQISVRNEVELSIPFGIATWQTGGAFRKVRLRPISR